jgi:putative CocE/NonD family hydrolase
MVPGGMRGLLITLLVLLACAPSAFAAEPPAGTSWTETYLDTPDGERLHTDVLRPAGATGRTPVILVVSPYLGLEEPVTGEPGPSSRFSDFFEGAKVFERGYSVVMVSTRGTGGSSGCLDILGPGEQTDVVTAVKWAAAQPWSTGKVGMYGKSYDANTGVVGAALRPQGLAAVVAQQIVPDRYRGSYSGRVRLFQSLAYPSVSYGAGGEGTFSLNSDPEYILNSVSGGCGTSPAARAARRSRPSSRRVTWT